MINSIEEYKKILNIKPTTSITVHLTSTDIKDLKIKLTDRFTNSDNEEYRILSLANVDYFITEYQVDRLFDVLERGLYEETFRDIEDKYLTERARRKKLEEEVENLKQVLWELV